MSWGKSSAGSNLITLALTLSHRSAHSISWLSASCADEWMSSNVCQALFNSQLAYGNGEEVALNLNSISIDCNICVISFSFSSSRCGVLTSPLTPVSFLTDTTSCAAVVVGFSHRMLRGQRGCSNSDRILRSCVFVCFFLSVCDINFSGRRRW